jgi:8-oxo-dGTP pyrophosphatase MutT (NUDIX family)
MGDILIMATTQAIPSATLILLKDGPQGLETLLLRRHSSAKFLPGVWVFPGGGVEPADEAHNELDTARQAAVRETIEEAGVSIAPDALVPISQWITPVGAPKRFSTWFFIAPANTDNVKVDGEEIEEAQWLSLGVLVQKHRAGQLNVLPPTLVSIQRLQPFATVQQALDFYRQQQPVSFFPKADFSQEKLVMLYPGDAGYEESNILDESCKHRCVLTGQGWVYINEAGI